MDELFRDQIWTFVGAAFAGLAIVISVVIYLLQRKKKSLGYKVLWRLPLLKVHNELKERGQLTISFNGQPVEDIQLLLVEIVNTGNVPIIATDYERPLTIRYGDNTTILGAEVVGRLPEDIDPKLSVTRNAIDIEPLLLNPGDEFVLKTLVKDLQENPVVVGRVTGVSEIKHIGPPPKKRTGTYYTILGIGFMIGAFVIPSFQFEIFGLYFSSLQFRTLVLLIGVALFFYGNMPVSYWEHLLAKRR